MSARTRRAWTPRPTRTSRTARLPVYFDTPLAGPYAERAARLTARLTFQGGHTLRGDAEVWLVDHL